MSERTTKQSFLNFIFKETVLSGNSWSENGKEGNTLISLLMLKSTGG